MKIFDNKPEFPTTVYRFDKNHRFRLSRPCNCEEVDHIHKHCVDCDGVLGEDGDMADYCYSCYTRSDTLTEEKVEIILNTAFKKVFSNG